MTLVLLFALSAPVVADVVVDFDGPNASGTSITGAGLDAYLAGFGITVSNVTPSGYPEIHNHNDHGPLTGFPTNYLVASSGTNFLSHGDGITGGSANASTNAPISYQLDFFTAMDSVSFTRIQINAFTSPSGALVADWQARALDNLGNTIATVGEPLLGSFGTIGASSFTLNGPNIWSLVIERTNTNFAAGTNTVFVDDLVLRPTAVPEPTSAWLATLGFGAVLLCRRRRAKR